MEIPQTDQEKDLRDRQKEAFNNFMYAFINCIAQFYEFDKLHKNYIDRNDKKQHS